MSESQQKLVLAIIEFLNGSLKDVKSDDKESLEVAIQCIGEAFGVDPNDDEQVKRLSVKPTTLQNIFDVFLKTKEKVFALVDQRSSTASPSNAPSSQGPSEQDKAQAEKLKQSGNSFMSSKNYVKAIDSYTQAIALDDTNPVYFSNRAAAHTSQGDYLSAINDSKKSIALDSKFVKAYHRLGHAHYCLADYSSAAVAFKQGLELDSLNINLKTGYENSKARMKPDDAHPSSPVAELETTNGSGSGPTGGMPDLASMASMFGGAGGGSGAGGSMPDFSNMMNNPVLMAAAQRMAADGGLDRLMNNPAVRNMMTRMQSGGGMPDMAEIMADPELRNLASQFGMGGAGR